MGASTVSHAATMLGLTSARLLGELQRMGAKPMTRFKGVRLFTSDDIAAANLAIAKRDEDLRKKYHVAEKA